MTSKWLMGTAIAALFSTGAIAQDRDLAAAEGCRFDANYQTVFGEFDTDADQRISREEYANCLEAKGLQLSDEERTAFLAQFDDMDADADSYLVMSEVETVATGDKAAAAGATAASTDVAVTQKPAKITVTQPPAKVTVKEGEPKVVVRQAEPTVAVEQKQPEVAVEQQKPEVTVEQPEAKVAVSQPQPKVSVDQPAPKVTVAQRQPEVKVQPGQPKVAVETAKPEVAVTQPEPKVAVSQPQPQVEVKTAEPQVSVQEAKPAVAVEKVTEVDAGGKATTGSGMTTAAADKPAEAQSAATAQPTATVIKIDLDELDGRDVYNASGEEIGEIHDIKLDPQTNRPVVVIEVGGFLGLGEKELVFDYDKLTIGEDRVVLNTNLTEDQLKEQPEYDEARYTDLPDEMVR